MPRFIIQFINKYYKGTRTVFLRCRIKWVSHLFFILFSKLESFVLKYSRPKTSSEDIFQRIWKQGYLSRFGVDDLYQVETNHPVAIDSDDHKWPRGTAQDNSLNLRFNHKLYAMLGFKRNIHLLDLGCAGGALVRSMIEDGHTAIGIEGSDHSKKLRSREWDTCPLHLFTADITQKFTAKTAAGEPVKFDVVTSWEVLEHIPEDKVNGLAENICNHLKPGGFFFGSVCLVPDENPITGAVYHVSMLPREWWEEKFLPFGLVPVKDHLFEVEDYVRGNASGLTDWDPRSGGGFHLVMQYQPK